ncbi:hypothetical protein [Desulfobacterium sp. N47]|uniref:STAS domain-containing protein n=1 Tax=uncultured Desulfobacterium sp. TaxID=201089 RepID=E1YIS6_9BACT|nr:hypothetical protein N47_K27100 [uncultured Desulfobacterium sp.]CBX31714.1 hypothetical protein N47_E52260 [uncultured Desulfobacterium sp.]
MASNFRIIVQQNKGSLHVDLIGEFDGFSAIELIDVLKNNCDKVKNIFINTSSLFLIHPLALDIFQKECLLNDSFQDLLFIGKYGNMMEPQESESFWF